MHNLTGNFLVISVTRTVRALGVTSVETWTGPESDGGVGVPPLFWGGQSCKAVLVRGAPYDRVAN